MIIVFGSLNLDMFLPVERLPERGETVLTASYSFAPGGKGANQAVAAAHAVAAIRAAQPAANAADAGSMPVVMVGATGNDDWAAPATALMREAGIDLRHTVALPHPTACASIWVEQGGENEIVVASGANGYVSADQVPEDLLQPGAWLVLQMEIPPAANDALIRRAHAAGVKVLFNIAPARVVAPEVLDMVDVLVLNEGEAATLLGEQAADPAAQVRTLAARHDLLCVVTLGAAGAVAAGPGNTGEWRVESLPLKPAEVVDTTGAGDAFVGALAAALAAGHPPPEALRWASAGAGIACLTLGCQPAYSAFTNLTERLDDIPTPQKL